MNDNINENDAPQNKNDKPNNEIMKEEKDSSNKKDSIAKTEEARPPKTVTIKIQHKRKTHSSKPPQPPPAAVEENYEDEPDETLEERLWGLTEMFPEIVRNFCGSVTDISTSAVKNFYKFSCNASWIFFTSSMILFAPVIFETERAQMEEMQRSQQKQVLLGPGSAMSSGANPHMPALPPMTR